MLTNNKLYAESCKLALVLQSNPTNLFNCLKTQHELLYNECIKAKKDSALALRVNHSTSNIHKSKPVQPVQFTNSH